MGLSMQTHLTEYVSTQIKIYISTHMGSTLCPAYLINRCLPHLDKCVWSHFPRESSMKGEYLCTGQEASCVVNIRRFATVSALIGSAPHGTS